MTGKGIDISVNKRHSVRSAASFKAKANNPLLQEIMKTAGWSLGATSARLYDNRLTQAQPLLQVSSVAKKDVYLSQYMCYQLLNQISPDFIACMVMRQNQKSKAIT